MNIEIKSQLLTMASDCSCQFDRYHGLINLLRNHADDVSLLKIMKTAYFSTNSTNSDFL